MTKTSVPVRAHRPQPYTVFGAAIVAGAAAAFGLNSALDTHLAQAKPQVESESILVALRALPAGAPVTVWDVGLRDWPKAMVPSTAMRVTDDLDDLVVRHPLREGQPILAVQLGRVDAATADAVARPLAVATPATPTSREPERDLWEATPTASAPSTTTPPAITTPPTPPVASTVTTVSTTFASASTAATAKVTSPLVVATKPDTPAAEPVPSAAPVAVATSTPRTEPTTPTETVVTTPVASTAPTAQPQPPHDPPAPVVAAPEAMAVAVAPLAPTPAVEEAPVADAGTPTPSPLRTALRPRSAVVPALSVPSPSALSDEPVTGSEDEVLTRRSSRAPAATAVAERSVTVRDTATEAPRMLPSGRDTAVAQAAATAQVPRASQQRSAAPRASATAPATRSARAQGFTKGYRPN